MARDERSDWHRRRGVLQYRSERNDSRTVADTGSQTGLARVAQVVERSFSPKIIHLQARDKGDVSGERPAERAARLRSGGEQGKRAHITTALKPIKVVRSSLSFAPAYRARAEGR